MDGCAGVVDDIGLGVGIAPGRVPGGRSDGDAPRVGTATLLTNGTVPVAAGTITPGANLPIPGRIGVHCGLLPDGRVLIAGGINPTGFLSNAVVYVP